MSTKRRKNYKIQLNEDNDLTDSKKHDRIKIEEDNDLADSYVDVSAAGLRPVIP